MTELPTFDDFLVSECSFLPWNVFSGPQCSLYGDEARNSSQKWLAPGVNARIMGPYLKMSLGRCLRVSYRIGRHSDPAGDQKEVKTAHLGMYWVHG